MSEFRAHPLDLLHQRLTATWREDHVLLKAWCTSIAAAKEVQHLLAERGWSERERIQAANELAKAAMQVAPGGTEVES